MTSRTLANSVNNIGRRRPWPRSADEAPRLGDHLCLEEAREKAGVQANEINNESRRLARLHTHRPGALHGRRRAPHGGS